MRQVCVESGSAANGLASREAYSAAAACRGIIPNRVKPCVGTGPVLLRWYPSLATVLTQAPWLRDRLGSRLQGHRSAAMLRPPFQFPDHQSAADMRDQRLRTRMELAEVIANARDTIARSW